MRDDKKDPKNKLRQKRRLFSIIMSMKASPGGESGPPPALEEAIPTYVGFGTQDATAAGNFTPVRNAGWQEGDYEIIQVGVEHAQTLDTPTGVTLLAEVMPGDLTAPYFKKMYLFGRRLEAGSTDQTFLRGSVINRIGWCSHIVRGVYEFDPIDAISTASEVGVAMSCPSLTTNGPNRLIMGFSSIDSCSGYTNTNLANILERKDTVVNDVAMSNWTAELAVAAPIGATTWNGPNTDGIAIAMLAINPE